MFHSHENASIFYAGLSELKVLEGECEIHHTPQYTRQGSIRKNDNNNKQRGGERATTKTAKEKGEHSEKEHKEGEQPQQQYVKDSITYCAESWVPILMLMHMYFMLFVDSS